MSYISHIIFVTFSLSESLVHRERESEIDCLREEKKDIALRLQISAPGEGYNIVIIVED